MPRFDFKCDSCNGVVELLIAMDSIDRPLCDKCQLPMTKVYTPPMVSFKGGGWGGQG